MNVRLNYFFYYENKQIILHKLLNLHTKFIEKTVVKIGVRLLYNFYNIMIFCYKL